MKNDSRLIHYIGFNLLICIAVYFAIFTDLRTTGVVVVAKALLWIQAFMSFILFPFLLLAASVLKASKESITDEAKNLAAANPFLIPLWIDMLLDMTIVFVVAYAGWT